MKFYKLYLTTLILCCCSMLVIFSCSSEAIGNNKRWLSKKINGKDCKIQLWTKADYITNYDWNGQCRNGFAQGDGRIVFYKQNDPVWRTDILEKYNIYMRDGVVSFEPNMGEINISIPLCKEKDRWPKTAGVNISTSRSTDIAQDFIAKKLLNIAAQHAIEECSNVKRILINLDQDPSSDNYWGGNVSAVVRGDFKLLDNGNLLAEKYENNAARRLYNTIQDESRKQQINLRKAAEIAARKEQDKRKYYKAKKSYNKAILFTNKNKIDSWVSCKSLSINPFRFKNKNIGIIISFKTMISENEGVFSDRDCHFVVSDIPSDKFSTTSSVLLAAEVEGKRSIPSIGLITYLRYKDSYFCKESQCNEFYYDKENILLSKKLINEFSQTQEGGEKQLGGNLILITREYHAAIFERLHQFWSLPEYMKKNPDLAAIVVITITENGQIANMFFEDRSGNRVFDQFVAKTIEAASPLPPIPAAMKKQRYEIGLRFKPGSIR